MLAHLVFAKQAWRAGGRLYVLSCVQRKWFIAQHISSVSAQPAMVQTTFSSHTLPLLYREITHMPFSSACYMCDALLEELEAMELVGEK